MVMLVRGTVCVSVPNEIAALPSISEGEGEVSGPGQVAKDLLSCLPVDAAGVVEKT